MEFSFSNIILMVEEEERMKERQTDGFDKVSCQRASVNLFFLSWS
jgi:hypothetical protein